MPAKAAKRYVQVHDRCEECKNLFAEDDFAAHKDAANMLYRAYFDHGKNRYFCQKCTKLCAGCGQQNVALKEFNGITYCEACFNQFVGVCPGCSLQELKNKMRKIGNCSYCRKCVNTCKDCRQHVPIGEAYEVEGGLFVCHLCVSKEDDGGHFTTAAAYKWEEKSATQAGVLEYNHNVQKTLAKRGVPLDKMFMGVELEVEVHGADRIAVAKHITHLMDGFALTKRDGSVPEGFEIVTCPATFEEQYKGWDKFFEHKFPIRSYQTQTCGMHVHMSYDAFTPLQLARFWTFFGSPKNTGFIETMAGRTLRSGNGFNYANLGRPADLELLRKACKVKRMAPGQEFYVDEFGARRVRLKKGAGKRVVEFDHTMYRDPDQRRAGGHHYEHHNAIQIAPQHGTVEVRVFRGTLKRSSFYKNLEFCHALAQFCRPGNSRYAQLLTPDAFVNFIKNKRDNAGVYKNLAAYIEECQAKREAVRTKQTSLLDSI